MLQLHFHSWSGNSHNQAPLVLVHITQMVWVSDQRCKRCNCHKYSNHITDTATFVCNNNGILVEMCLTLSTVKLNNKYICIYKIMLSVGVLSYKLGEKRQQWKLVCSHQIGQSFERTFWSLPSFGCTMASNIKPLPPSLPPNSSTIGKMARHGCHDYNHATSNLCFIPQDIAAKLIVTRLSKYLILNSNLCWQWYWWLLTNYPIGKLYS